MCIYKKYLALELAEAFISDSVQSESDSMRGVLSFPAFSLISDTKCDKPGISITCAAIGLYSMPEFHAMRLHRF